MRSVSNIPNMIAATYLYDTVGRLVTIASGKEQFEGDRGGGGGAAYSFPSTVATSRAPGMKPTQNLKL